MKSVIEVDARGEVCPVPMMKAVAAMKQAGDGEIIEVFIDYAPALDTIPTQCTRLGWDYTVAATGDPEWKMTLTRSRSSS
jgi:TusA-related sulfurtransferase